MDVIINENEIHIPVEISTWGDLLDWVVTDYLTVGQCITHVYLNGNEALNYRDASVCGEEIDNVTPVAIKSGDFDRVFGDSWRICSVVPILEPWQELVQRTREHIN